MKTLAITLFAGPMLAACEVGTAADDPTRGGNQGGQSGSLIPAQCQEVDRVTVADLAWVPDGVDHSAQDVIDVQMGTFEGDFAGQPLTLGLEVAGPVELVYVEVVDTGSGPKTGPAPGAPAVRCGPFQWEIPITVTMQSAPDFDEVWELTMAADTVDLGRWSARLGVGELQGTYAPNHDPDEWDETWLHVDAQHGSGAWDGSAGWISHRGSDRPSGPSEVTLGGGSDFFSASPAR